MTAAEPARSAHSADTVWLWRIDLDRRSDRSSVARSARLLSPDELARADRFLSSCHRARFVTRRAALRRILAHTTGEDVASLRFRYGPSGKPQLESSLASFSVSHANGRAVIAVTERCSVGVDIERDRAVDDRCLLARAIFSDDEWCEFDHLGRTSRAFLSGWTRKEALGKATGEGLGGAHAFGVAMGPAARLHWSSARWGAASDWTLHDLSDADYVIALAVRSDRLVVKTSDTESLLT